MDIKLIITGRADKKTHGLYLLALIILFFTLIITSASVNLIPFTLRSVCVSNLGNPTLNPRGWWIFTLVFVLSGILLIPHQLFIYFHLMPKTKFFTRLWLFLQIIGDIGMIGVGIFNETMGFVHYIFAGLGFGGIGLAILYSPIIFIRRIYIKENWPSITGFLLLYVIISVYIYFIIMEVLTYGIFNAHDLFLTEWIAFALCFTWIFGLYFLIPKKIQK